MTDAKKVADNLDIANAMGPHPSQAEIARGLALKANQALRDGKPLVLESLVEKTAVRSYAEREFSYWWAKAEGKK